MTQHVNTLLALTALWASRPTSGAAPEQVAAWYAAKSRTHEALAAEAPTDAERCQEMCHAAAAAEHARQLLLDTVPRQAGAEAEAVYLAPRTAGGDRRRVERVAVTA